MDRTKQEILVRAAMLEADKAAQNGNSPFGAVLSDANGTIIGAAYNTCMSDVDPTAHAEINLLRKSAGILGKRDLSEYWLISNAQSCTMCFAAAVKSRIRHFIFGADSERNMDPALDVFELSKYCREEVTIIPGVLEDECRKQIEDARGREDLSR